MNKRFAFAVFTIASVTLASCGVPHHDIEGTYVIAVDLGDQANPIEAAGDQPEQTLTIGIDESGEYSAFLSGGLVGDQKADEVNVDKNEFSITFVLEVRGGMFEMSYIGKVKDGELSGTFSSGMGDFDFTGTLKEDDENTTENESDMKLQSE
ncbi:MAG: hypothetical protein OXG24_04465 [Gammaproteobacteria bacterium]|nr:hypothetical protein [Gammaproteobacteria bacterium]